MASSPAEFEVADDVGFGALTGGAVEVAFGVLTAPGVTKVSA